MDSLYLDANASAPPLPEAIGALALAAREVGNPSSPHALGRKARRVLDEARRHVAAALAGGEKQVTFTSGASEANRFVVDALVKSARSSGRPLDVIASPFEHPSLIRPLEAAAEEGLLSLSFFAADERGALAGDVERADVVVVTAAHNETGIVPRAGEVFARARADALVVVDAAQAVGRLSTPVSARADVVVASAHKMGGLAGAGALLLRGQAVGLQEPWLGGGQEGGRRPGTEPLALLAAFGAAAAVVERTRGESLRIEPLRDRLEGALLEAWPRARVVGAAAARLPNTSAITVPSVDGDALRMAIDRAGVCAGFGSACSALAPEPSAALLRLGLSREEARATVRLSLACGVDERFVDEAVARLRPLVVQLG